MFKKSNRAQLLGIAIVATVVIVLLMNGDSNGPPTNGCVDDYPLLCEARAVVASVFG